MGHRTALVAAGSIAVVVVAAVVAVGANLGILNAADSRPVGQLSATLPAQTGATTEAAATPQPTPQTYVIRKAGSVSVVASRSGLRLGDVHPRHGWRWSLRQSSDSRLSVTFSSGTRTYTFLAVAAGGGAIRARVDHPVTRVVASPPVIVATRLQPATAPAAAPAQTYHEYENDGASGGEADD